MLDNLASIATIAGIVFTIASVAWAGSLIGRNRDLRETCNELRAEVADHDRREADAKEMAAEIQKKLVALQYDHAALGRVVTGETYLVAISDGIDEVLGKITRMEGYLMGRGVDKP